MGTTFKEMGTSNFLGRISLSGKFAFVSGDIYFIWFTLSRNVAYMLHVNKMPIDVTQGLPCENTGLYKNAPHSSVETKDTCSI